MTASSFVASSRTSYNPPERKEPPEWVAVISVCLIWLRGHDTNDTYETCFLQLPELDGLLSRDHKAISGLHRDAALAEGVAVEAGQEDVGGASPPRYTMILDDSGVERG